MLSKDFPTGILGIQAAHGSGGRDTGCHLSTGILSQDSPYRLQAIPDGIPELHKASKNRGSMSMILTCTSSTLLWSSKFCAEP